MNNKDLFKVYINIYGKDKQRITQEQRTEILKQIEINDRGYNDDFSFNKNIFKDKHLPYFYNERFYFGDPIVLSHVTNEEINKVLALFAEHGFDRYWITYKYQILSFEEVKKLKIHLEDVRIIESGTPFIDNRSKIFLIDKNLVIPYIDGYADIKTYLLMEML